MTASPSLRSRFWARVLLRPSRRAIVCSKVEIRVSSAGLTTQLWGQVSGGRDNGASQLVVLRLLGARGRAELATLDPVDRAPVSAATVWTMNPPGFGGSDGPLDLDGYKRGALAAFDFVRAHHPGARVWVYGKCIGGAIALHVAASRSPDAIIVKNLVDVAAVTRVRLARWLPARLTRYIAQSAQAEIDVGALAAAALCPALFVVSREDEVANPDTQFAVARTYAGGAATLSVHGDHDRPALAPDDEQGYVAAIARLWSTPARSDGSTATS